MSQSRTARRDAILAALKNNQEFGITSSALALLVNAPVPSVRRAVATLRSEGYVISSTDSIYKLVPAATTSAPVSTPDPVESPVSESLSL